MKVYGFSSDYGDWCFLSEADYKAGVAQERKVFEDLPGFTAWEAEVPDEILIDAAYEYISINEANGNNE
jgi:hypothetical protein